MNESGADIRKYSIIAVGVCIQDQFSHTSTFQDEMRQALQSIRDIYLIDSVHIDSIKGAIDYGSERVVNV